jgi:large subunit ribosomal protein L29
MKARELREKTNQELRGTYQTLSEELFNARFQHYNGQLENTQKIPSLRRDLARVKTLMRQRELGLAKAPGEATPVGKIGKE